MFPLPLRTSAPAAVKGKPSLSTDLPRKTRVTDTNIESLTPSPARRRNKQGASIVPPPAQR